MLFNFIKKIADSITADDSEESSSEMYDEDSGYDTEEEFLDSLKKDDSYYFTFPFEYIKRHLDNGDVETGTAYMNVSLQWSDSDHGYILSHSVPNMYEIDPSEGNTDEQGFYEDYIRSQLEIQLDMLGIPASAICFGY